MDEKLRNLNLIIINFLILKKTCTYLNGLFDMHYVLNWRIILHLNFFVVDASNYILYNFMYFIKDY